ncbi:Sporulation related domain-containing protein [Vibrio gazogenes DSM 21264]|uniref:Sporulation related domain-containing protein n=2 Tax=Vibrio gazogenes TaxID=687 RepID=A0A1M5C7A2_VIBGA|nr:Sporulation related domain-containing protein [Vibrio gazogenes DSM 21264] [Vibrio gazogenes DSM 21264 = NBRC 103151]
MGMIDTLFMKGTKTMEKKVILGLSTLLLAACSSGTYVTDVTTESYQEEYPTAKIQQPVVSQQGKTAEGVTEMNVVRTIEPSKKMSQPSQTAVTITPPTAKQVAMNPRFGYTIQVVAVGTQSKVDKFSSKLPKDGQPVWENYKVVNGTKWYTVLYGDFATRAKAHQAIQMLPAEFRQLKPFVKSIDAIKNSEYPTLNKLN